MQTETRAAVWAAVSSRPQTKGDSIERQVADGRRVAEQRGWLVVAELVVPGETREYVELSDAVEGLSQELRPGERNAYRDLLELLDARSIDYLICRGRDRLGRTDSLVAVIEERARRAGCVIHSMNMPGTGQTDSDLYLAALERAGAQRELVELRRRMHYGMNARARKGKPMSSVLPFGYRTEYVQGERQAVVDPVEAEAYRWAVRATLDGVTQVAIRGRLNEQFPHRFKTDTAVRYVLRNPFHVGLVVRQATDPKGQDIRIEVEGQHEALIDRATWDELQRYLDVRAQRRRPPTTSLWSGILYCDYCGGVMYTAISRSNWLPGRVYHGYHCSTHVKSRGCRWNHVTREQVTKSLIAYLTRLFQEHESQIEEGAKAQEAQKQEPDREQELREQLMQIDQSRQRLIYLFTSDRLTIEDYDRATGDLRARQQAVETALTALETERKDAQRRRDNRSLVQTILPDLERRLEMTEPPQANRWLRDIFRAVYLRDGEVVRVDF